MSSFAMTASDGIVRVEASGTRFIPLDQQDGIDRMLHPLGVLQVVRCPRCGGPAHVEFMPPEFLYRLVGSYFHCHGCGEHVRMVIAIDDNRLPGTKADSNG